MSDTPLHKTRIKHNMDKAEKYTNRKRHKHEQEMNLIKRALPLIADVRTILDAPCGVGRSTIMLSQEGYQLTGVDLGKAAVEVAAREVQAAGVNAEIREADIENLPWEARHFDAVLCFRLFHHFPDADSRRAIVRGITAAADKYVLISYISPWSWTSMRRRVRKALTGKRIIQHHTSLEEVTGYFDEQGFELVQDIPLRRFFHSLHLAVFKRR